MKCVFYVFFLLVSISISTKCPQKCGNVSIYYPFGIGRNCYHNHWFEVQCKKISLAFLPKINHGVLQISLPDPFRYHEKDKPLPLGSVRINAPITSSGCGKGDNLEELLNFIGSPYFISNENMLVALGCNTRATLTKITPRIVGCVTSCDGLPDQLPPTVTSCFGFNCCNVTIPEDIGQVVGVRIESNNANRTRGGCRIAFLTDQFQDSQQWHTSNSGQGFHAREYTTVHLKWDVPTSTNLSFQKSLGCLNHPVSDDFESRPCICESFTEYNDYTPITCACSYGFKGNPYVLDGCKDECLQNDGRRRRCLIKKNKTNPVYIGLSIGLGVLIVGIGIWLYRFVKKQRKMNLRKKFFKRNGGLLLEQELTSKQGFVEKTRLFSSKELEKATEKFSSDRVLGQGGQGTVYKGMLTDGRIVAVKQSKAVDEAKVEEFINEVVILSQINHRNVVSLLGCCLETEVPVLVYEFICNGNLSEHLHSEVDDRTVLSWETRLQIAVDISSAISYLHSTATSPIYHRDIKATNIMLDEKFRAKVSDFGTSRSVTVDHTHLTTVVLGTVGYVDPEYFQSSRFTDKSDVYSFGIVLVEIITGEKPISFQRSAENRTLATYFIRAMKERRLIEIIDSRIIDSCKLDQVTAMATIARVCLHQKGENRPTMREVSMELERICSGHSQQEFHNMNMVSDEEDEIIQLN